MKRLVLLAAIFAAGPLELGAQLPSFFPAHSPLVDTWYPVISFSGKNGFVFGGHYGVTRPIDFSAEDYRPPYMWSVSTNFQVTTNGSRQLSFHGNFPAAIPGWRLTGEFRTQKRAREDYYGIGNDPDYDTRNLPTSPEEFSWAIHLRTYLRGEGQRRLAGNLYLLAGIHTEHWRLSSISANTQLALDSAAALDPSIGVGTNDVTGRLGLIFDSRSDFTAPRSGVLLEAIVGFAEASVAGDLTYRRTTLSASAYQALNSHIVLAGRAMAQTLSGDERIGSFYIVESGRHIFEGIGGSSHRGLPGHGLLGADKLLFNFDVRYDIFPYPSFLPVTLVAWIDAGRVFHQENLRLTFEDMSVGAGSGLFLQIGRSAILGVTVGRGPVGTRFTMHSRWPI